VIWKSPWNLSGYPGQMAEPNGWVKWRYLLLGITPPREYREWVLADVSSPAWAVRRFLQIGIGTLIGIALVGPLVRGMSWDAVESYAPGALLGGLIGGMIAGVLQATVLADFTRRWTVSYYRKRWDRQLIQ
jgi:hypothetical protein